MGDLDDVGGGGGGAGGCGGVGVGVGVGGVGGLGSGGAGGGGEVEFSGVLAFGVDVEDSAAHFGRVEEGKRGFLMGCGGVVVVKDFCFFFFWIEGL